MTLGQASWNNFTQWNGKNISESGAVNDFPNDETYDFPIDIEILDNHQYHCVVDIQHRSDSNETKTYDGPNIIINTKGKFQN